MKNGLKAIKITIKNIFLMNFLAFYKYFMIICSINYRYFLIYDN